MQNYQWIFLNARFSSKTMEPCKLFWVDTIEPWVRLTATLHWCSCHYCWFCWAHGCLYSVYTYTIQSTGCDCTVDSWSARDLTSVPSLYSISTVFMLLWQPASQKHYPFMKVENLLKMSINLDTRGYHVLATLFSTLATVGTLLYVSLS